MGQGHSAAPHEPLGDRHRNSRRSLRHIKPDKGTSPRRMDRLRRSFRDSFKRRKDLHIPESSKPHQWQSDESAVRSGTCNFHVKYLGCVEVFESRGMQVCEEALKVLRNSRRRPVKAILHISGDGLRVVEDETKGLIVDQTIEKVSFCAPDRNCEKGFSYICRDGTTRRWMCHGFLALRESVSGERLSHAVGCAFAACLERKQKRDKECGVTMTFDNKNSTFTRTGSFRQASITDRLQDPQDVKPTEPPPVKQVFNPYAIERPHATVSMLQRQGSFRGFQQLNQASPFKRQMSLRISDLPSTLERQRSLSLEGSDFRLPPAHMKVPPVSPIPEASPLSDRSCGGDSVAAMCQQLAQGLSLLSSADDLDPAESIQNKIATSSPLFINKTVKTSVPASAGGMTATTSASHSLANHSAMSGTADTLRYTSNSNNNNPVTNSLWSSGLWNQTPHTNANHVAAAVPAPPVSTVGPVTPVFPRAELPDPEQWLGTVVSSTVKASPTPLKRAPPLSQHLRAHSLGSSPFPDPFDAEWASVSSRNHKTVNTNPFVTAAPIKAFEVQM